MIPRNHPQYVEIETFEDHELTICMAYEMAIRSPGVREIINRNLYNNSYYYAIDTLCRVNLILSQYSISSVDSLSAINIIKSDRFINTDLKNTLESFGLSMEPEKYFAVTHRGIDYKYTDYVDISYQFYCLVEKIQSEIGGIRFEDIFIEFENIGMEDRMDNLIESAQNIENFYKSLTEDEQNFIKKLIALNIYKSDPKMHNDVLYSISEKDANELRYKYYLDTFDKDDICSMQKLHLTYSFINIYDNRVTVEKNNSDQGYIFQTKQYLTKPIILDNKSLTILYQRPLLAKAKTVENFIFELPKHEFSAQIEWIKQRYADIESTSKKIGLSSIFFNDDKESEKPPPRDKGKLADVFFLYDNMKVYDKEKEVIQTTYARLIKNLHKYQKSRGVTGKVAIDNEDIDRDYTTTFDEKKAEWIKDMKNKIEILKRDNENNIKDELMKHHNEVLIVENNEFISYSEYQERSDPDHPQSLFSAGEISFPGMGRTSMYRKYKDMKNFIDERKYKKLL